MICGRSGLLGQAGEGSARVSTQRHAVCREGIRRRQTEEVPLGIGLVIRDAHAAHRRGNLNASVQNLHVSLQRNGGSLWMCFPEDHHRCP